MLPVDTATALANTGTDLDGEYTDSNALARALSKSESVRACMARQVFRASVGRSDPGVRRAEEAFIAEWSRMPVEQRGSVVETLVALVRSRVFVERSAVP
jgi:hypothetical protein